MSEPAWWVRALELERDDRLEDAEKVIDDAMLPNYPAPLQIAELYRLRCVRLLEAGRIADASDARERALRHMGFYVGCSTSGGEAAARLVESDDFERELPTIPGDDAADEHRP